MINGKLILVVFTEQISSEVSVLFDDVTDEFRQISSILERCEEWRKNDFNSYKDTYFSLCLPKVIGVHISYSKIR